MLSLTYLYRCLTPEQVGLYSSKTLTVTPQPMRDTKGGRRNLSVKAWDTPRKRIVAQTRCHQDSTRSPASSSAIACMAGTEKRRIFLPPSRV
jgi:hypothetical protein